MYENLDLWCISNMVSANPLSFLFANFLVAFMIRIIKTSLSAMNVLMQTIFYIKVVSIVLLSRRMRDGLWHDLCQTSLSTVFIVYLIQKRRQCFSTKSYKSWQIERFGITGLSPLNCEYDFTIYLSFIAFFVTS